MNNWSDFDRKLKEVAVLDLAMAGAARTRNEETLNAQVKYDAVARPLMAHRGVALAELERFYKANRKDAEVDGRKSIELTFGRAGMRKGNPTLALRKGWSWEKVLDAIEARYRDAAALLNIRKTVNKEAVKALVEEEIAEIGCRVKQEEEFFVETYTEKVDQAA